MDMPRGFQQPRRVMKLLKSLYGLKQSPRNFFEHLKAKFFTQDYRQSTNDPCLFFRGNLICVVYVDDCLFFAETYEVIDETAQQLRDAELDLNVEEDVAGFLGTQWKNNPQDLFNSRRKDLLTEH